MKKVIIGIGVLFVLGGCFIALFLYTLSLPKFRNADMDPPFSGLLNKKLTTKKRTLLIKNPDTPNHEEYSYHLEDGLSYGMDSDLEVIVEIPIGTEIIIDKTEIHTGRVSGTSSGYLFGKVYSTETQETYAFEYSWGDYHSINEDKPYWSFEKAFWQEKPLTERYVIKVP